MSEFLKFFDEVTGRKELNNIRLHLSSGPVTDWSLIIRIGIEGEYIFNEQECDIELLFAMAHVEFKKWLLEHNGGY